MCRYYFYNFGRINHNHRLVNIIDIALKMSCYCKMFLRGILSCHRYTSLEENTFGSLNSLISCCKTHSLRKCLNQSNEAHQPNILICCKRKDLRLSIFHVESIANPFYMLHILNFYYIIVHRRDLLLDIYNPNRHMYFGGRPDDLNSLTIGFTVDIKRILQK